MKKLFYPVACLLMCATQAHAKQYFTGFYLTGAIGATSAQYTVNQDVNTDIPGTTLNLPADIDLSATSPSIYGALGYTYQFKNNFTLGAAFTAGYTDAKVNDTPSGIITSNGSPLISYNSKMEIQLTNDFALLFKPGYVYGTSTQFYTFLGPRWGNLSTSVKTNVSIDSGFTGIYEASGSNSTSAYQLGFTTGLGIQQLISPNYSWSLEYLYTYYGNIDAPSTSGTFTLNGVTQPGTTFEDAPSVKVITNSLMFTAAVRY